MQKFVAQTQVQACQHVRRRYRLHEHACICTCDCLHHPTLAWPQSAWPRWVLAAVWTWLHSSCLARRLPHPMCRRSKPASRHNSHEIESVASLQDDTNICDGRQGRMPAPMTHADTPCAHARIFDNTYTCMRRQPYSKYSRSYRTSTQPNTPTHTHTCNRRHTQNHFRTHTWPHPYPHSHRRCPSVCVTHAPKLFMSNAARFS